MGDHYPRKPSHNIRADESCQTAPGAADELSELEIDLIARRRADFLDLMPGGLPFFHDLYDEGLIDGWRSVLGVRPDPTPEQD